MSKIVDIDCRRISDWRTFHEEFARAFKFPDFYGANSAAWIDCITDLEGMTGIGLRDEDILTIRLVDAGNLKEREPRLLTEIFEMAAFVNYRRLEAGEPGRVCISAFVE